MSSSLSWFAIQKFRIKNFLKKAVDSEALGAIFLHLWAAVVIWVGAGYFFGYTWRLAVSAVAFFIAIEYVWANLHRYALLRGRGKE